MLKFQVDRSCFHGEEADLTCSNDMMESPVGTTYELPLLPVNPHVTDEANSCGKLSAAVVTDEGSSTV